MCRVARDTAEFIEHWNQKQNFLVAPECISFDMEMLPVEEVVDILRRDPAATVRNAERAPGEADESFVEWAKTAPLEQLIERGGFGITHLDLNRFYGPGQFLQELQDRVMIPWRTFLSAQGFTWQRCAPYIFITAPGMPSTYHADYSNVLAWQLDGEKTFNGFVDPDKYLPVAGRLERGNPLREQAPPGHDENDVLAYRMVPGDLLWNQLLTPHWVVAGADRVAMSLNISHGLVRHRGAFGANEALLHERWQQHPEEAWLADMRY